VKERPDSAASTTYPDVEIRRSPRRQRTVSAYRDGSKTIVLVPERMSRTEEAWWVATMLDRLAQREARRAPSDPDLEARAQALSERHLDGRARPASVRWSSSQQRRWGSCTSMDASIRLSTRLRGMPSWVLDYVIVHELVHLLVPDHSPAFWELVERYPRTERARGYLQGVADTDPTSPRG
jgi:predicted metal-dependent hydrolase